jgi:hypothetical protein
MTSEHPGPHYGEEEDQEPHYGEEEAPPEAEVRQGTDTDLHGTAREVAESGAGEGPAETPGGG